MRKQTLLTPKAEYGIMRSPRITISLILAFFTLGQIAEAKPKLPDWVKTAAEQPAAPRHDEEKPTYEILWDEAWYDVLPNGRIEKKARYAIRILDLQERWRAKARASYRHSSDTRPQIKAWTLHSNGDVYKYKKSDEKEARNSHHLETEGRTITVDGWGETRTGDVFAYEYTYTESSIFTQYYWRFQSTVPVALSRITVTAPEGWKIKETYIGDHPKKTITGNAITWESQNILSKEWEFKSPSSAATYQHIWIDVTPPENDRTRYSHLKFDTWEDLASFKADVSDPMAIPTPEIEQKALELTKDAQTDWEKIQALGEYAKQINYEHVALDIGNGGGYTPRPASETFRVGWGDCKDKSTILRSLLKSVGIDSYVVTVNATDNDKADPNYPSPQHFNHCITAVQVGENIQTPAVYQDEHVGRLLFIDPTWNNSPIGEIPFEAQGGLVVVGKHGPNPLVKLPLSTPEQNKTVREIAAEVLPNGSIVGRITTQMHGQSAVSERRLISRLDQKEYLENLTERFAAGGNPSPIVKIIEEKDDLLGVRTYQTVVDFAFKGYARHMQNVLMIFKPAILGRMIDNPFSEPERTLPVRLRSKMLQETATIFPPLEHKPDDFVPETNIETDFGSYTTSLSYDEEKTVFNYTRTFVQNDMTVPVERYQELQAFFASVSEAEQTPIVLARK